MKTCETDGCDRPFRAKRLCATHYNQRYQPNRHRKSAVECAWCGRDCMKETNRAARYQALFCTLLCRDAWRAYQAGRTTCPLTDNLPALWVAPRPIDTPVASWRRWVSGQCARCGDWFVAEDYTNTARYCSRRCAKRVAKHRHRARMSQAYMEDVSPATIFARDGWRCQICKRKVSRGQQVPHPKSPVLDHIVPLALGGTHEPKNVQCAHFRCNSVKSHRAFGDQLLLIG